MKKLADSGVKWIRLDLLWEPTEREKNTYDFSSYDRLVQVLDQHDLKAMFIFAYGNPLYDGGMAPYTDEGRQAFARWAAAAAKRYAGKGYLWEIWNEPNAAMFWRPKPNAKNYSLLTLAVSRRFREAGLTETLIGPASSGVDLNFIKTCFKTGLAQDWGAVSVHPYRRWLLPETAGISYSRLENLIRKFRPEGLAILSGEWGYSSVEFGLDEETQGKFLARMWLFNLASGIPLSIWYDWRDDGDDPHNHEHHFGLVRKDLQAKPAYLSAKTLTEELRGFRFVSRRSTGGSRDYLLEFSRGKESRWAVWTSSPKSHQVLISGLSGRFQATDFDGKTIRILTASEKGLEVTLRDGPQYLAPMPR
ncbi:MAG: cellulase family glycosylhydrolase [Deltaproteobacteria bacterium]|nr:cellulase family glycosylhydrolase [Deltaproteobacteria bacterium]